MERAIIYCAKTGLEATDHFVPELLEKYCNLWKRLYQKLYLLITI